MIRRCGGAAFSFNLSAPIKNLRKARLRGIFVIPNIVDK